MIRHLGLGVLACVVVVGPCAGVVDALPPSRSDRDHQGECLYGSTGVDVIVDVQGSFTGVAYTGIAPDRFLDTRD